MIIRQGDVVLVKIDKAPGGLVEKDKILARGETTGHTHRFESEQATVLLDRNNNTQYVALAGDCELIHEEHKNVLVPRGVYKVVPQREYDILEGARMVMD